MTDFDATYQAPRLTGSARTHAFLTGWWANRRYTRNISSLILAGAISIVAYAMLWKTAASDTTGPQLGLLAFATLLVLNPCFFPPAREMYFRFMRPLHEGLSGIWVFGFLVIVLLAIRAVALIAMWVFAIPLGILGGLYLGFAEANGRGWRLI